MQIGKLKKRLQGWAGKWLLEMRKITVNNSKYKLNNYDLYVLYRLVVCQKKHDKNTKNTHRHIYMYQYTFFKIERPKKNKQRNFYYPLNEILFFIISACISRMDDRISIANFGEIKLDWLRRFLPFKNGLPSYDVLGKLFARLDPKIFNKCFISWVNSISQITQGEAIAFDGKSTLFSSFKNLYRT